MSSLMINWRFGSWFLQVNRPGDWRYQGVGTIHRVPFRGKDEPFCAFYQGRGYMLLALIVVAALIGWIAA